MPPVSSRLDVALVDRGLAQTRSKAQAMVLAGAVLVDGRVVTRAGHSVSAGEQIELQQRPKYVSRGGDKLEHALREFAVDAAGKVCADIGASTGGFTDCLLQSGAERVYAIDVGYGQLDYALREDVRVVVMERVNARHLTELPELVSLVVIDVSFISLRLIFPVAHRILTGDGDCIALVKPQFEAGRTEVGKKGVVTDPTVHRRVLEQVVGYAGESEFGVAGLTRSPLRGPAGNVEFFLHATRGRTGRRIDIDASIDAVLEGS
jgi:23S rRNA (cytidine1920-2'-O)/16S rRNA (cytidine1409-2'-O)-methyltransferase